MSDGHHKDNSTAALLQYYFNLSLTSPPSPKPVSPSTFPTAPTCFHFLLGCRPILSLALSEMSV